MSVVENEQAKLADVVDTNSQAFSDSLRMAEAQGFVLQRVLNELVSSPEKMHKSPAGGIDFQEYLREYWLCMLMADFAAWCRTLQPEKQLIMAPTENEVVVFGGD